MKSPLSQLWRARACALLVTAIALPSLATAQNNSSPWTFHHNKPNLPGLTWSQLGKAYLGKMQWTDLGAKRAPIKGSRLVIADWKSSLGKETLLELGLPDSKPFSISERVIPEDAGLIVMAPDPDGDGRLVFFTGVHDAAVYQTLTVPADMTGSGWFVIHNRKIVSRGSWPMESPLSFDLRTPLVLRLDGEFFRLQQRFKNASLDERALILARRFVGERAFFDAALGKGLDLFQFHRNLLSQAKQQLAVTHWLSTSTEVQKHVTRIEAELTKQLGPRDGPAPAIACILGDAAGTNARTFGADPITKRNRVVLNMMAHADEDALLVSLAHELVHTRQTHFGSDLMGKAATEGVATFLSGLLIPNQTDAQLLMWGPEKLKAAAERKEEILAAFRAATKAGQTDLDEWLILNRPLRAVPGAPDRSAYWLGFMAAKKWFAEHPDSGAKGLLEITTSELFRNFHF